MDEPETFRESNFCRNRTFSDAKTQRKDISRSDGGKSGRGRTPTDGLDRVSGRPGGHRTIMTHNL